MTNIDEKNPQQIDELDLWGLSEAVKKEIDTPRAILRRYRENLAKSTGEILQGNLTLRQSGDDLLFSFYVVAPKLKDYKFLLFQVDQPITMYPLQIIWNNTRIDAETEEKFIIELKKIIFSDGTKKLLSALIAQSKA